MQTLSAWLTCIETTHNTHVDLSLVRMQQAVHALNLTHLGAPVITVAGTNGKGSVVCALETIYHTAGYRTASYSSPHLFVFNERIKVNTENLADEAWCQAFAAVYETAQHYQLTYFEVITLAAFWFFKQTALDIIILEVGLGGRLDAVNVIDPAIAIITSIDLDHTERLGATRALIAAEKAGIFRANTPVICGDHNPPAVLQQIAESLNAPFYQSQDLTLPLPENTLLKENMQTAVMAVLQLQSRRPVSLAQIETGLSQCHLPGRQQIIHHHCKHLIDVAHNPAGFKKLAERISQERSGRVHLVISMLHDKDIKESFAILTAQVDAWYLAPLATERAADLEQLTSAVGEKKSNVNTFNRIKDAYLAAFTNAKPEDVIVIAGSFYTVTEASVVIGNQTAYNFRGK